MKTIENKNTDLPPSDLNYAKLISVCVNLPPKEGFTVEDMRKRIRILDALEKSPIKIEDADYVVLKQCVSQFKWGALHKDIVEFVDYINNLKDDDARSKSGT